MAQSMIRLDDEVYTEIKKRADMQGRSYANLVNYYLKKEFGWLPGQVHGEPLKDIAPKVDDLFQKNTSVPQAEDIKHVPDVTALEKPCCHNENKPCQHWVWDIETGEGYKNILSGRYREAE